MTEVIEIQESFSLCWIDYGRKYGTLRDYGREGRLVIRRPGVQKLLRSLSVPSKSAIIHQPPHACDKSIVEVRVPFLPHLALTYQDPQRFLVCLTKAIQPISHITFSIFYLSKYASITMRLPILLVAMATATPLLRQLPTSTPRRLHHHLILQHSLLDPSRDA